MKKYTSIIFCTSALLALPSSAAILVAGWDTFPNFAGSPPTHLDDDTTAIMSGSGTWGAWNNNDWGASTDGTFGTLSPTVATATTSTSGRANLSLNRSAQPGTLTFTLTNNSAEDRLMEGFYFDAVHFRAESADTWTLSFGGAISGADVSGSLTQGQMMNVDAEDRNWGIDLTNLTDNVWEAGEDVIFTLTFDGGPADAATGGGHETLVDNIGITIVPEPSGASLLAIGLMGLLLRRRR